MRRAILSLLLLLMLAVLGRLLRSRACQPGAVIYVPRWIETFSTF